MRRKSGRAAPVAVVILLMLATSELCIYVALRSPALTAHLPYLVRAALVRVYTLMFDSLGS